MRIAICDDNRTLCRNLNGILQQYFDIGKAVCVKTYHTGDDFIEAFEAEPFDAVFMDIVLGEGEAVAEGPSEGETDEVAADVGVNKETGIDVTRRLRKLTGGEDLFVVYISSTNQPAASLVNTHAFDYLLKPLAYEGVAEVLDRLVAACAEREKRLTIKVGNATQRIRHSDILYVESVKRSIVFHTLHGNKTIYGKLNDIEADIASKLFLRVHHSFLVNFKYIESFDYNALDVYMSSGRKIPVSHPKKKQAYQQFLELCGDE